MSPGFSRRLLILAATLLLMGTGSSRAAYEVAHASTPARGHVSHARFMNAPGEREQNATRTPIPTPRPLPTSPSSSTPAMTPTSTPVPEADYYLSIKSGSNIRAEPNGTVLQKANANTFVQYDPARATKIEEPVEVKPDGAIEGATLLATRIGDVNWIPVLLDGESAWVGDIVVEGTLYPGALGSLLLKERTQTLYRSFDGLLLNLYPYFGERVVLLIPDGNPNLYTISQILAKFDAAYDYYHETTGREPQGGVHREGKAVIASVPTTCRGMGAGCGRLGQKGIELMNEWYDRLYTGVRDRGEFDQVVFYELGRSFWFYDRTLTTVGSYWSVVTGYAVFMRFMAMDATGVTPGPFNQWDFDYFRAEVEGLKDRYLADPTLDWSNTIAIEKAPANPIGLGATDLFASFLMALDQEYGDEFLPRFWREVGKRAAATSSQHVVGNIAISASIAAGVNLAPMMRDEWRWPITDATVDAINTALE